MSRVCKVVEVDNSTWLETVYDTIDERGQHRREAAGRLCHLQGQEFFLSLQCYNTRLLQSVHTDHQGIHSFLVLCLVETSHAVHIATRVHLSTQVLFGPFRT